VRVRTAEISSRHLAIEVEQSSSRRFSTVPEASEIWLCKKRIMSPESLMSFQHRHNKDGTIDSICIDCLMTIATSEVEADLAQFERDHTCDPSFPAWKTIRSKGPRNVQT
jgi:hypothetical protein